MEGPHEDRLFKHTMPVSVKIWIQLVCSGTGESLFQRLWGAAAAGGPGRGQIAKRRHRPQGDPGSTPLGTPL